MSQKGGKSQHQGQKRPNLPFANEPRAAGKSTDGKKGMKTTAKDSEASVSQLSKDISKVKIDEKGDAGSDVRPAKKKIPVIDFPVTKPLTCTNKQGDFGTPIELQTNYFKLETLPDWVLYQYRVDFSIEEERESVLRSYLLQHKERLNTAFIFDGTMLFTYERLSVGKEPVNLVSIRESDQTVVDITIRLVQELNYLNSVYLQVFNILVRRCLRNLNLFLVNRNHYDPKASIHLYNHNMEVWPGYVTAIRTHDAGVLMCSEISHKVMRTDTAFKILLDCTKETHDFRTLYQQTMIGSVVLTDYNNKTYRVDDVDFTMNPESKFRYKNGEMISFVEYYKNRYQIKIKDLRQPLLISRCRVKDSKGDPDKQCILVPELCRMTGLTDKMLENRTLMKDLSDIVRLSPEGRLQQLSTFNKRLQNEKKVIEDFKSWGMKLSSQLVTVKGRQFPPETLLGGNNVKYSAGVEVDWTRYMRSSPVLLNGKFECFVVICPYRLKNETESFLSNLNKAAQGMRFCIPRPVIFETRSDSPGDMLEAVENVLARQRPDLILFTFTSDRADRYAAVKKKCYVDRGLPSQVVLARTLRSKGILSVATKVAVQINSKIGGAPWTVPIPVEHAMVVGFDVCHDKSRKSKSVGALVASLNKPMSAWYSSSNFHTNGEELSDNMANDMGKALKKYLEFNKVLPDKIFIYRDGVGEGQIQHVLDKEVSAVKQKLTEVYGGENWKMMFIIVTKRINTRLFNRGRNPLPGTIVDSGITLPDKYDFFLVSQSVRQGTVSPTSYNVISDNIGWNPNYVQRFTYKMTHLYYNCSVSIRVPAPCQYAHKLAFLVSQSLHAKPHSDLNTRLYFL